MPAVSAKQTLSVKRRKVSAESPDAKDSVDVGPVSESREEHLRRHDGGRNDCPRCRFYLFGAGWMRTYGSAKDPRTHDRIQFVWLQERPTRFQGQWALGCAFCAHAAVSTCSRQRRQTGRGQRSPRRLAKWSRHEVRPEHLQSEHIRKHALSGAHKLAEASFFAPDAPLAVLLQKTIEDEELLQGAVPTIAHFC